MDAQVGTFSSISSQDLVSKHLGLDLDQYGYGLGGSVLYLALVLVLFSSNAPALGFFNVQSPLGFGLQPVVEPGFCLFAFAITLPVLGLGLGHAGIGYWPAITEPSFSCLFGEHCARPSLGLFFHTFSMVHGPDQLCHAGPVGFFADLALAIGLAALGLRLLPSLSL